MALINIFVTLSLPLMGIVLYVLNVGYRHRAKINQLRKQGVPMPAEWNWLTGHLLVLKKYVDRLPPDANVALATKDLAFEFADTEIFLMDFWPVYPPLWMVFSPETAVQISTKYNLSKSDIVLQFMQPITGGPNLVSMSDDEWKTWRSIFNPGFSASSMMNLVPQVVNSVQVFCDKLRENAGSGLFCLDDLTTRLTMDIILRVVLDMDLDYQRSDNDLATALNRITSWHSFWDPRVLANPLRPIIQKYYGYVMNKWIRRELDQRFFELRHERLSSSHSASKRAKSVIALALEAYLEKSHKTISTISTLDDHFANYATYQIRLFLFAGNDTTSSSIIYAYHMLSKHPNILARVRQEHDHIFGTDPSAAAGLLRELPALLNQCSYTLAVIKETLRLFPPAGTNRKGRFGVSLTDRHGNVYPADYVGATILHTPMHLNPRVWPHANEFLPERWLVEPGHELYPDTAAYRPFEQGPRNCIGQTLVYNEMRIVLVMTARTFDIQPAYDEWDAANPKNEGIMARLARMVGMQGPDVRTVSGERAYQTEKAGTHPADGYPCRVKLAA